MSERRIPEEQIVPRGRQICERSVRPEPRPQDEGGYAVDDEKEAFARASGRADPAALFFARVGTHGAPVPAHRTGRRGAGVP